ncbi:hypothetical protein C8R47DRAFT_1223262 [Mycena vitilis]|nr:hypothetical protein C8R47DRAFT_1223262 [Mycena vitilis]
MQMGMQICAETGQDPHRAHALEGGCELEPVHAPGALGAAEGLVELAMAGERSREAHALATSAQKMMHNAPRPRVAFTDSGSVIQKLKRAAAEQGRGPKELSIFGPDWSWVASNDKVVAVMIPHRALWEYLKIDLTTLTDVRILAGPIPLLHFLELTVDWADDQCAEIVLHPSQVPLLRTLILISTPALEIKFPWTRLTSLTLRIVDTPDCVPVLVQTGADSNLVHCELYVGFGAEKLEPRRDITLRCLESLIMIHFSGEYDPATNLFPTFIVPALRRLGIYIEIWLYT